MGVAPSSASVRVLNSMTCGWSISYTTVWAGQASRYARESNPEARITTCLMPARVASMKNSSKNLVRTAWCSAIRTMDAFGRSGSSMSEAVNSPLASRVRTSTPTARTSGSAN
ncbi:Uncharacterised protein [Mycobacterium tuberculosis]|nr:Uncharacterised protein [Mycobacterium tuberculosis]